MKDPASQEHYEDQENAAEEYQLRVMEFLRREIKKEPTVSAVDSQKDLTHLNSITF